MPEAPPAGRALGGAFAAPDRRAALMPYMMGGFPTMEESLRVGQAYAEYADLMEVGVPSQTPSPTAPRSSSPASVPSKQARRSSGCSRM